MPSSPTMMHQATLGLASGNHILTRHSSRFSFNLLLGSGKNVRKPGLGEETHSHPSALGRPTRPSALLALPLDLLPPWHHPTRSANLPASDGLQFPPLNLSHAHHRRARAHPAVEFTRSPPSISKNPHYPFRVAHNPNQMLHLLPSNRSPDLFSLRVSFGRSAPLSPLS